MSNSLVELIFSAVGTDQAAAAVQKIKSNVSELAQTVNSQARPATTSWTQSLQNTSATLVDQLTPALDSTTKQLLGMAAAALSLRAVYSGFADAIGDGKALEMLSRRTGENVRDLVVYQQAFRNAGLGANYLAIASNLLDRALSPLNQNAKRNAEVFAQMGVSMPTLRTMDFGQQVKALSEGLARLPDQASRTEAVMQIFGRYAGGQMLQLLGDPQALDRATEQAGRLGDKLSGDAAAFTELSQRLSIVNLRLKEMWVTAAEQVLPSLSAVASLFERMNLSGLGAVLGATGPTAIGGLLGTAAIGKLDLTLLNSAERFEGTLTGSLYGAAASATGALAKFLPMGLAAAIAIEIVAGILQAYNEAQIRAIYKQHQEATDLVDPSRKAFAGITNQGDAARALAQARADLAKLKAEAAPLQKRSNAELLAAQTGQDYPYDEKMTSEEGRRLAILNEAITKLQAFIDNIASNPAAQAKQIAEVQLAAIKQSLQPLVAQLPELQKKNAQLTFETMTPAQQAASLQAQRAGLERQLATPAKAGLSSDEVEAQRLNLQNQLLEVKKQQAEVDRKLTEQAKQQAAEEQKRQIYALETQMEVAKAAGNDALAQSLKEQIEQKRASVELSGQDLALAKQRATAEHQIWQQEQLKAAAKKQIEGEQHTLETTIQKIRDQINKLDADYTRTEQEKWAVKRQDILQEITDLKAAADKERALAAAARAPGGAGEQVAVLHDQAARGFDRQGSEAQGRLGGLGADPHSFLEQLKSQLTQVRQQFGTIQQTIAGGFAQAFSNASAGLQKLIGDTNYWSSKLGNIAGPILGAITKGIADMFTTWIVQRGIAAAKNILFSKEEGLADAAAKAPGAILTSISSFGVAALVGVAAVVAAMAAFGGFESGGFTYGREGQPAGVVHGEEFVYSAPAVRSLGRDYLEAQHRAALGKGPAPAMASMSGGSASRESARNIHIYMDRSSFSRAMQEDSGGWFREMHAREMRS